MVSRGEDADTIWVTEAWTDREAHDASLRAPGVPETIARARPLIAGMDGRAEFAPLAARGLTPEPPRPSPLHEGSDPYTTRPWRMVFSVTTRGSTNCSR